MKLIKLTDLREHKPVYINPVFVVGVTHDNVGTYVWFGIDKKLSVTESVDQVLKILEAVEK